MSQHFAPQELDCPCCSKNECTPELYAALEEFRAKASAMNGRDTPVIVTSGYRCAVRNAAVGGAKASQHLAGRAADIRITGRDAAWLESVAAECVTINGVGRDDHRAMLHIDVRPGAYARWCYSAKGRQMAYYPANGGNDTRRGKAAQKAG